MVGMVVFATLSNLLLSDPGVRLRRGLLMSGDHGLDNNQDRGKSGSWL